MTNATAAQDSCLDFKAETDEAVTLCGGDARAALKAGLVADAFLEHELERIEEMLWAGYGRGHARKPAKRQSRVTRALVEDGNGEA
jgi:hypothetical protein